MKKKIGIFAIQIIIIAISFFIGLNFYEKEDANRDGEVDIKDLIRVQKYILSEEK